MQKEFSFWLLAFGIWQATVRILGFAVQDKSAKLANSRQEPTANRQKPIANRPMTKTLVLLTLLGAAPGPQWGFFAHEKINRLAVFTLPPEMISFYKKNIDYLSRNAVNPDKRRYVIEDEAPRHYLDADHYGAEALQRLPHDWNGAVAAYGVDTLMAYGILPWHIQKMYYRLKEAFMVRDPERILRLSAELGHYLGDACVPLHTTENYDGQLTGQQGIHGFWESRLPEQFSDQYDFFVGRAGYVDDTKEAAWKAIEVSHALVPEVLEKEKELDARYGEKKYAFETRGKATVKVYGLEYSREYHTLLGGMVERQMRASVKLTGDFWFTAWVDAGQPDLDELIDYKPTEQEQRESREAVKAWRERGRRHD